MSTPQMHALIYQGKVVDITKTPFTVTSPFFWQKCTADVRIGWHFASGSFKEPPAPTYRQLRRQAYLSLADQMDEVMRYFEHQRQTGTPLMQTLETIVNHWQKVKEDYPKPDNDDITPTS